MSELFKNKYLPVNLDEFIGDMTTLQFYIKESLKGKTKGKSFILFGSPGTGKSTIVNILAKEYNMDLVITNSSDNRNHIDPGIIHTSSLLNDNKKLIVFDECDGMDKNGFKELEKVISNYSPIILIANDINKIPGFIKSKSYQKQVTVDRFALKVLAKKIIKEEGLNISDNKLNESLKSINSYRGILDFLQFGFISDFGSFNTSENIKDTIQFTSDNSESPNLISLADIYLRRSQQGYKSGQKIAKYILDSIDVKTSNYPRTYRLIAEARKPKKKTGTIKILGFK